jgi:hypothetical protein
MTGRHSKRPAAHAQVPAQRGPHPLGITDTQTHLEHLVTDESLGASAASRMPLGCLSESPGRRRPDKPGGAGQRAADPLMPLGIPPSWGLSPVDWHAHAHAIDITADHPLVSPVSVPGWWPRAVAATTAAPPRRWSFTPRTGQF